MLPRGRVAGALSRWKTALHWPRELVADGITGSGDKYVTDWITVSVNAVSVATRKVQSKGIDIVDWVVAERAV